MNRLRSTGFIAFSAGMFASCSGSRETPQPPGPVTIADAPVPLTLSVTYPRVSSDGWRDSLAGWQVAWTEGISAFDSSFIYGMVSRPTATLEINGHSVPIHSSGSWLAWLPLDQDSIANFRFRLTDGADTVRAIVRTAKPFRRAVPSTLWIDSTSFFPTGDYWLRPGERFRLSMRTSIGADVRLLFPWGDTLYLEPEAVAPLRDGTQAAFEIGVPPSVGTALRYQATWQGLFGPDPGPVLAPYGTTDPADSNWVRVEATLAGDTVRARWPLRVAVVESNVAGVVDDDPLSLGGTDSMLPGRPAPSGTYHWFFPTGTRAAVTGRIGNQLRFQMSRQAVAWVDADEVRPIAFSSLAPNPVVVSPRAYLGDDFVGLRLTVTQRVPFEVRLNERRVSLRFYGARADMDFMQHGPTGDLVRQMGFNQPAEDEAEVWFDLGFDPWGYRTRWEGANLFLEVRRPPIANALHPLAGRMVALDPGHPPGGTLGPSGVREEQVTLAVARKVAALLEDEGAGVIMLRDREGAAVQLLERVQMAELGGAEVLVSIHANAVPDGVNPIVNSGTSVYYFHPQSAQLARDVNASLVDQLGFRDLGVGRGDLAMARVGWMPAVLTEGLFLMVPDHEAVLLSEEGQWRYARGIVEGLRRFMARHAKTL